MDVQKEFETYRARFPRNYSSIPIIIFFLNDNMKDNTLFKMTTLKKLLKDNIKESDLLKGEYNTPFTLNRNRGRVKSIEEKFFESYCIIINGYKEKVTKHRLKSLISKDYIKTLKPSWH